MDASDLARILDELQSRLSGPAKYAFDLVVRQVVIEGAASLLFGVGAITVAAIGMLLFVRNRWGDEFDRFMALVIGGLFAGIGSLAGLALIYNGLLFFLNPEYAALQRLLSLVVPQP